MSDFIVDFSPIAVLALAFLPVIVIAGFGAWLSPRVPAGNDALLTSVLRVCGGGLILVAAFMIADLWGQTDRYLEKATSEYSAGWRVDDAVRAAVPAQDAEAMTTALRTYREQVTDTEIGRHVPPGGSEPAIAAFEAVRLEAERAAAEASSLRSASDVRQAMTELTAARDARVDHPDLAGLPGVVIVTILLLAWIAAFLLGLFPGNALNWVKIVQTASAALVLGMVQMAVFYMATRSGVIEIIQYALQI